MRNAVTKASVKRPAPRSAANTCSRMRPRRRDAIVAALIHSARPMRTGAAFGAGAAPCEESFMGRSVLAGRGSLRRGLLLHEPRLRLRLDRLRDVPVARDLADV